MATDDEIAARRPQCGGFTATGRRGRESRYWIKDTAGERRLPACGVHMAQVVKHFLHEWHLAAEVSEI